MLTSGRRRSPRRRYQDLAAVTRGLACLGATSCALVRPSDEKSESACTPGASHVLGAGTAALARRGIAVWDQVPRAGVVRNDVASLSAPSRAAGSATARTAARCSDMPKSSTFAHRRSPRGRFEQYLAVGSRLARLGAAACALRRPSGTNSAVPPRCLAGRSKSVARAARAGMGVSMRKFNRKVARDDGTDATYLSHLGHWPSC